MIVSQDFDLNNLQIAIGLRGEDYFQIGNVQVATGKHSACYRNIKIKFVNK
jgi:hypothetical protein